MVWHEFLAALEIVFARTPFCEAWWNAVCLCSQARSRKKALVCFLRRVCPIVHRVLFRMLTPACRCNYCVQSNLPRVLSPCSHLAIYAAMGSQDMLRPPSSAAEDVAVSVGESLQRRRDQRGRADVPDAEHEPRQPRDAVLGAKFFLGRGSWKMHWIVRRLWIGFWGVVACHWRGSQEAKGDLGGPQAPESLPNVERRSHAHPLALPSPS